MLKVPHQFKRVLLETVNDFTCFCWSESVRSCQSPHRTRFRVYAAARCSLQMSSRTPSKGNRLIPGGLLSSKSATFQVQSTLGEGAFGKVVKCVRVGCTTPLAIKVIKNRRFYRQQAKKEVRAQNVLRRAHWARVLIGYKGVFLQIDNLVRLKNLDHDKCSIIRIHGAFYDRGYYCMIFEHLDRSLYDYMNQQQLRRLPLFVIKWIVCQVIILLFQCSLTITDVN